MRVYFGVLIFYCSVLFLNGCDFSEDENEDTNNPEEEVDVDSGVNGEDEKGEYETDTEEDTSEDDTGEDDTTTALDTETVDTEGDTDTSDYEYGDYEYEDYDYWDYAYSTRMISDYEVIAVSAKTTSSTSIAVSIRHVTAHTSELTAGSPVWNEVLMHGSAEDIAATWTIDVSGTQCNLEVSREMVEQWGGFAMASCGDASNISFHFMPIS